MQTDGDITPFFTRPICIVLWGITFVLILMTIEPVHRALQRLFEKLRPGRGPRTDERPRKKLRRVCFVNPDFTRNPEFSVVPDPTFRRGDGKGDFPTGSSGPSP